MEKVDTPTLSRLLRPMIQGMRLELARELAALRIDAEAQSRYEYLADGHTEGALSPDEEKELASFVQANALLGVLKAGAQERLRSIGK